MESILTKNQKKIETKLLPDGSVIRIELRYDDCCGNGHNTFSITGEMYSKREWGKKEPSVCGCIHKEIKKYFPEYEHLIKWHGVSSKEPMHYIANSLYFASNRELEAFKVSASWYDATMETIAQDKEILKKQLQERLPNLISEFRKDIEALGFIF